MRIIKSRLFAFPSQPGNKSLQITFGTIAIIVFANFSSFVQPDTSKRSSIEHVHRLISTYKKNHSYELKFDRDKKPYIQATFLNTNFDNISALKIIYEFSAGNISVTGKQDLPMKIKLNELKVFRLHFTENDLKPIGRNTENLKIHSFFIAQFTFNNGGRLLESTQLYPKSL